MIFNKCFWLGHKYVPMAVNTILRVDTGLKCTLVAYKCSRCSNLTTDTLEGIVLTLEQLKAELK